MIPIGSTRIALALLTFAATAAPAAAVESGEILFARTVRPLLKAKCLACHGNKPDDLKGGLDLRTAAAARAGGDSGRPAVVTGKPDDSPLYLAVTRTHADWSAMPPKENDRLTAEQVRTVRDWVAAGAAWPDDARADAILKQDRWDAAEGVAVATSGGLSPEWTNRRYKPENLWAYRPPRRGEIPSTKHQITNPIDTFLLAKLESKGLTPAPPADRRTLIRRVTFDLTGLPPTPAEIDAFLNDPDPDATAFARVVDRLLASPQYGEQMARHWLDVVRYADSAGFANDYARGPAWRYRDYVVRAFNADMSYDRFVREQIAGDEIDPADPEKLVAVGFLRTGAWELTGMEVAKVARQRFLDDVTDAVGQVFLGHMLQCARCHDHKFDPVPTRDYYRLQAAFAGTQLADRPAAFLPAENTAGFEERTYLDARKRWCEAELKRIREVEAAGRAKWAAAHPDKKGEKPPLHEFLSPADLGLERIARKGLERLTWEYDRYEPVAVSVYNGRTPTVKAILTPPRLPKDRGGEVDPVAILAGGDPFSPTQPVEPGVLSAVPGKPPAFPKGADGRRRALADWIASKDNPLAARVMANRIWQWHFGRPLAANPNNFGATGGKPTHPELHDHLAATFVEDGWSVKRLHRLILLSEAYRRSSDHPDRAALAKRDPDGTSCAVFRPRRLTAEELRDAMLAVSGELNPAVGGIPVRPEISPEVALQPRQVMGTFAPAWEPSPRPGQRHRRSLYALKLRGLRDPLLEVFNQPNPDLSCEAREASTVTPQVFALFNGKPSHARALAFAARLRKETATREAAIDRAFALSYGRPPTADERSACLAHWAAMAERHRGLTFSKAVPPQEVVRTAVEENTGEKFSFTERLPAAADFVPDLQPSDVDAETRGLADVCLVLFNANEFVYVY